MRNMPSFFHKIRGKLSKWKTTIEFCLPLGRKAYLIGTPTHNNVGDSAIVIASLKFLRECSPKAECVKEMTIYDHKYFGQTIDWLCNARSRCFCLGGGNMGDLWFTEELFRRKFLVTSMQYHPMILPQTIHYADSEQGRQHQENSVSIYNDPRLTIVAREQISFDKMRHLYPKARVLLTPDIVLSTTAADYGILPQKRSGILWVMRSDKEKSMTPDFEHALQKCAEAQRKPVRKTDMYSDQAVTKQNRDKIVKRKFLEFASSELVITDRLHGMIFAAIAETPCIVFGNNHHKVRGTYEWLRHLPYIRFAETISDAETYIPELLEMKDCHFDNAPLLPYFEMLKQEICKENA